MKDPKAKTTTKKTRKRVRRTYKGTDAQAFTVCLVQIDNAIDIQSTLADRRARYTPKFLDGIRQRVCDILEKDLGIDPRTAVQLLTGQLTTTQSQILTLLRSFSLDLRAAFTDDDTLNPQRLPELQALLGFRDHYELAAEKRQQPLSELLAKFATATDDPTLRTELETTLGIASKLIDDIRAQKGFYLLDAAQEKAKAESPAITDEIITRFNATYRAVQSVASLARDILKEKPAEADKFSFSLLRRRMTGGASDTPDTPDTPPAV